MFGKQGEEKKYMTQEEAFKLVDKWADDFEVTLRKKDYEDFRQEIWIAVQKERLVYNSSDETFNYILKKPILNVEDNSVLCSKFVIKECRLEGKKEMQNKKNGYDSAIELYKAYCKNDKMEDLPVGYYTRLADRDLNIITAIILGFFVQAVPQK